MVPIVGGALIATIIAFLTGLLALMSQESVTKLSDISDLSLMILLVGSALTFFKDFNAIWTRKMLGSKTGTNAGSPAPVGIVALLLACLLMSACAGTKNAYRAAEGLEETAKVVGEHYYALVREANALAESGQLSGSALTGAQDIVRSSRPIILELAQVAQRYEAVRSASNEAELERAINDAAIAVSRLVDIISAWRTTRLDILLKHLERIDHERPAYRLAA